MRKTMNSQFRAWMVITIALGAFVVLMSMPIPAHAQTTSVTLGWDAPTHRAGGTAEAPECGASGEVLTAAEIATLGYAVSYRKKGTTAWTNKGSTVRTYTIEGLAYSTAYEATVSAHWPGETGVCPTEIFEFTTGAAPGPGACSNLRKLGGN